MRGTKRGRNQNDLIDDEERRLVVVVASERGGGREGVPSMTLQQESDVSFWRTKKDGYQKLPKSYQGMKGHAQVKIAGHLLDIVVDKNGLHVVSWRPSGRLELSVTRFDP